MLRKLALFAGYAVLALFIIAGAGVIWGALIVANLETTPSVPWRLPALVVVLWLLWQYLGGKGWPRHTAEQRRWLRRANPVSMQAFAWTALAGGLAIVALAGIWIVTFQLFPMPPNRLLPDYASSPLSVAATIIGASLLAPIAEETAIRGYLQTILEREFAPVTAVVLSSVVFAVAHVTQGLAWPRLLVYFLVGVAFGTMAYLNNSILPVIPVHMAADLAFFLLIWLHDATRKLENGGADTWFWLHVAQTVVFSLLTVWALRQLRHVQSRSAQAASAR